MKKIFFGMFTILLSLCVSTQVHAAVAYSVGCDYPPATGYNEDTTQLAMDAATGYGFVSDITGSYYNLDPTYDYINSTTRFGNSRVFFIAGHANYNYISVASSTASGHMTGISTEYNGFTFNGYKFAGLSGRNMSPTKVITFAGCYTAKPNTSNLVEKAVSQGASAAVGWMFTTSNNRDWLKTYNYSLGYGYTVYEAVTRANAAYGGTNTAVNWNIVGDRSTTITSSSRSLTASPTDNISLNRLYDPIYNEISKPLSETYLTFNFNNVILPNNQEELFEASLSSYENEFSSVINFLNSVDETFDTNDYSVTYRVVDADDGVGMMQITYHINNRIKTNKGYLILFENYEAKEILLSGVKKVNIENISNTNLSVLNNKISNFNLNKNRLLVQQAPTIFKNTSNSILSYNNQINRLSLKDSIVDYKEYYYYDYNSEKLEYVLEITDENLNAFSSSETKILVN